MYTSAVYAPLSTAGSSCKDKGIRQSSNVVLPVQRLSSIEDIMVTKQLVLCIILKVVDALIVGLALSWLSKSSARYLLKDVLCADRTQRR
jgi:hypothetical protein